MSQLSWVLSVGAEFWPPTFWLSLLFFFASSFILFFFPPLTLFTIFFTLHFILHPTIYSRKNYFPKLFNTPSFISLNFFFRSLCSWALLLHIHFLVKHIFKLLFSLHKNVILFQWTLFPTFHGKKYHPSFEWNDEEGLLQDPMTVLHIPTWTSRWFFLWFLCLEKCCFHASLKVWWWDIVILLCALVGI